MCSLNFAIVRIFFFPLFGDLSRDFSASLCRRRPPHAPPGLSAAVWWRAPAALLATPAPHVNV